MTLDRLYDAVCAKMARGEPVDLDDAALLDFFGYVLPSYDPEACCGCNLCSAGDEFADEDAADVSPNEVTVSFTDHTTDTVASVTVDSDGDFIIGSDEIEGRDPALAGRRRAPLRDPGRGPLTARALLHALIHPQGHPMA